MSRTRFGLCVTMLFAGTTAVEAGGWRNPGCAAPLTCAAPANCAIPNCAIPMNYGCAVPSCAIPLSCAAPNCAMPMNYGCAAPSCAMPYSCAAPPNCAGPSCAQPSCAAPFGGPFVGYDAVGFTPDMDHLFEENPFEGLPPTIRYPTRGITPAVIPGDEIVW